MTEADHTTPDHTTPRKWEVLYDTATGRRYIIRQGTAWAGGMASADIVAEVLEDVDEETPSSSTNAQLLCRAVNSFDTTREALELAQAALKAGTPAYRAVEQALYLSRKNRIW